MFGTKLKREVILGSRRENFTVAGQERCPTNVPKVINGSEQDDGAHRIGKVCKGAE
jgi:hypothetical protein